MKEIIERKLERLNKQYDKYLNRWDKIEDTFSSENDYITDRLNEIRSNIRLCNEILEDIKENQIDYKSAYENSFECNKILSNNYNDLDKRINKAIEKLVIKQMRYLNEPKYKLTTLDLEEIKNILKGDSE